MESESNTVPSVTVASLSEGSWPNRIAALAQMSAAGTIPAEFLPAVVGLLACPESERRAEVVAVVSQIGPPVVPHLIAALADESPETADFRRAIVVTLGQLGPAARPSVPLLLKFVDDPWLGLCARSALATIEPAEWRGWPLVLGVLIVVITTASAALALLPLSRGPGAAAVGVVGMCVAVGVWRTRPRSAASVLVFLVGIAIVMATTVVGSVSGIFDRLARALVGP